MDVKTAIRNGDAVALSTLLAEDASRADALIRWGENDSILTHPLHYVSDMLFQGTLKREAALPADRRAHSSRREPRFSKGRQRRHAADRRREPRCGRRRPSSSSMPAQIPDSAESSAKPRSTGPHCSAKTGWRKDSSPSPTSISRTRIIFRLRSAGPSTAATTLPKEIREDSAKWSRYSCRRCNCRSRLASV